MQDRRGRRGDASGASDSRRRFTGADAEDARRASSGGRRRLAFFFFFFFWDGGATGAVSAMRQPGGGMSMTASTEQVSSCVSARSPERLRHAGVT